MAKCPNCNHEFSVAEAYNAEAKRTFDIHKYNGNLFMRNKNGLVIPYNGGHKKIKWFVYLADGMVVPLVHYKANKSWYVKYKGETIKIADILNEGSAEGTKILGADSV